MLVAVPKAPGTVLRREYIETLLQYKRMFRIVKTKVVKLYMNSGKSCRSDFTSQLTDIDILPLSSPPSKGSGDRALRLSGSRIESWAGKTTKAAGQGAAFEWCGESFTAAAPLRHDMCRNESHCAVTRSLAVPAGVVSGTTGDPSGWS
jgi:hypothetical protein